MTRFQRLQEVVNRALALPSEDREAYLQNACGDDAALLAEAQRMVDVPVGRVEELLEHGVAKALGERVREAEEPPNPETGIRDDSHRRIGPYRIQEMLGAGGMGAVYRAQQTEPIRREVALKLIRGGMASEHAVARFEIERQVLASLSHPNIAQVHDAGSTEDGLPYFAMELVDGVPITEYCSTRKLETHSRIELFTEVCRAVQHAHNKGVIHRDLKPSNILITERQKAPVPKIIDFGIAKALDASGDYVTMASRTGALVGTLEYMSPEQASGGSMAIDTRSDVYALGVVLYELVAERLPYDLAGLSALEAVQRLAHETPSRLTTGSTGAGVRRDLEIIVMKSLEKDPVRRYESAAALADDLERYLRGEPIAARAPSAVYQFTRLVMRHKIVFGSTAMLALALLAFGVSMSILYSRQQTARRTAVQEAEKAKEIGDYLAQMVGSVDRLEDGSDVTVAQLLEKVSRTVDEEVTHPDARVAVRKAIAHGFFALGRYVESHEQYRTVQALLEHQEGTPSVELLDVMDSIVATSYYLGDYDTAIETCQEIVRLRDEYVPEAEGLGVTLNNLARLMIFAWRFDEAVSTARRAVEVHEGHGRAGTTDHLVAYSGIAIALSEAGEFERSAVERQRSVDLRMEYLGENADWTYGSRIALAETFRDLGHMARADSLATYLAANPPTKEFDREGLTRCQAMLALHAGREDQAVSLMRRALSQREGNFGTDSPRLYGFNADLAYILLQAGDVEEALAASQRSVALGVQSPRRQHPNAAATLSIHGACLTAAGRHAEAETILREALSVFEAYGVADHWQAIITRYRLAICLTDMGRWNEARIIFNDVKPSMHRLPYDMRVRSLVNAVNISEKQGDTRLAASYRADLASASLGPSKP